MKMRLGIIISNHGKEPETEKALKAQFMLDEVRYYKHPDIDPRASKEKVWRQAQKFLRDNGILNSKDLEVAVINGEYGFSTACVQKLRNAYFSDMKCLYPTTERNVVEDLQSDGSIKITHVYKFVQFREW
jgi:hypothetical protein